MRLQYAKVTGLNVAAVDVDEAKLDLARRLGASLTVNASTTDPVAYVKKKIGGAHGVLVTAVSPKAFEKAIGMVRRGGTVALTGLPPGQFPLDIFGMVFNGVTVCGSLGGTRLDLQESLDFVDARQGGADCLHRQAGQHQRRSRAPARGPHRRPRGVGHGGVMPRPGACGRRLVTVPVLSIQRATGSRSGDATPTASLPNTRPVARRKRLRDCPNH